MKCPFVLACNESSFTLTPDCIRFDVIRSKIEYIWREEWRECDRETEETGKNKYKHRAAARWLHLSERPYGCFVVWICVHIYTILRFRCMLAAGTISISYKLHSGCFWPEMRKKRVHTHVPKKLHTTENDNQYTTESIEQKKIVHTCSDTHTVWVVQARILFHDQASIERFRLCRWCGSMTHSILTGTFLSNYNDKQKKETTAKSIYLNRRVN